MTKKKPEAMAPATKPPRQRSQKAERQPVFPWPLSKVAADAAEEFRAPLRAAIKQKDSAAIAQALLAQSLHPEAVAKELIEKALQEVHLDPRVHRDAPWLGDFVMLMREMVADFVPGMTLLEMLAPLQTALSQHGGGRPLKAAPKAVLKTQTTLEAAWQSAPQKEAARKHGITDRTVRNYATREKKKPG